MATARNRTSAPTLPAAVDELRAATETVEATVHEGGTPNVSDIDAVIRAASRIRAAAEAPVS